MEMDELPLNIMFDLLSRMPVKSLACFRCVSKLWCEYIDDGYLGVIHGERVVEEPTTIMFHRKPLTGKLSFNIIESEKGNTGTQSHVLLEPEKEFEFVCKKPLSTTHVTRVQPRGSCNGLLVIAQDNGKVITNFSVIHPRRKECYELPPFPLNLSCYSNRDSFGLGFDASTNTLKMVCVLLKEQASPKKVDLVRKNLCTMVHVFGTNSWQKIPKVPSYPVEGEAIFSHGCLHWLVCYLDNQTDDVIWFDLKKEEFGLIGPPKRTEARFSKESKHHLANLNGEVGLVCNNNVTMEVWVLKDRTWVLHCQFNQEQHFPRFSSCWKKVLGFWNKDGDISIKATIEGTDRFFVYNLKSGVGHEVNIFGQERYCEGTCARNCETGMIIYPHSLFSIRGINTNSNSIQS